jgi:DNA-binding protein HU-beta
MNKTDLVEVVALKTELSKKDSEKAVKAVFDAISEALEAGDKIQLVGFGTFAVKFRKEKQSKNPQTGAKITVPATYRPSFAAGKALKEVVAKYKG